MIPIETKQQILDSAHIEEVVGDFVTLKRRGTTLIGLCPFHNEKTPSFIVSPAKGIFKCFGCGKGGDSVSFVMEHEQSSYPEALKYLAQKYGIKIEEEEKSADQIERMNVRESLFGVSLFAASYFKNCLWNTEIGKTIGLSYFRERGFSDATIETFELGYCQDTWDLFTKEALKQSYSLSALTESGLSIEKDDKVYDRFRGRVMFPIHSLSGKVVGFGGRILTNDKNKAKYVNSPESVIYNKSQVLYGIFQAKREIISKDMAYLVEGYTDVISLYQAGIKNVVASSGTSLTQDQIKLVSRFTKNITVLYDGDAAGIKASFRGIDMLLERGLNVRVLLFPDNHDPDSFSRSHSSDEISTYLAENAVDFIRFKTQLLLKEVGDDPIKRAELIENIIESISLIPEEIHRAVYIQECSRILHIEEADLISRLNKIFRKSYHSKLRQEESGEDYSSAIKVVDSHVEKLGQHDEKEIDKIKEDVLEKSLLRLLLCYGRENTTQCFIDEEGNEISELVSVGVYIVRELENDEVSFKDTINQKILEAYIDNIKRDYIPTIDDFLQMEDDIIKNRLVDISYVSYELSPVWEKKNIFIKTESESQKLDEIVKESVINFKLRELERIDKELDNKIKNAQCEEEAISFIEIKKEYCKIKMILSEKVRRILS